MKGVIIICPSFSNKLDSNEYPIEVEYNRLPLPVQREVLQYFQSNEFIQSIVRDYVLQGDVQVDSIEFRMVDDILCVYLYGTLLKLISLDELTEGIKDGFHKASHSGPLVQHYGQYLGDNNGRYSIYLNYDRTNVIF